jgi:acetylglutamate kinase
MVSKRSVRETVMKSLMAIGSGDEAAYYAGLFQEQAAEKFALIAVDPRCLQNPLLDALISDLKIISDLDLTPVLVVGGLDDDRTSVRFQAQRLCKSLDAAGIKNAKLNCASYQLMPDVLSKVRAGRFAVLEMTESNYGMNLVSLTQELQPAKVIFLQPSGGFRVDGERVPVLNIEQIDTHIKPDSLTDGQSRAIESVREISGQTSHHCTFVVASPLNLLTELFTVGGSGTLLRRGATIKHQLSYGKIGKTKLRASMDGAFERVLVKDYFSRPISHICLEDNYRGGAIVTQLAGLPYLSKFWVIKEAQGEGIARDI